MNEVVQKENVDKEIWFRDKYDKVKKLWQNVVFNRILIWIKNELRAYE